MEVISMDLEEALEHSMGGYWFDFEQGLTLKDAQDPAMSGATGSEQGYSFTVKI
jgi:hypothetical protein